MRSPMATPPRGDWPCGLKMPSGRFCSGKSGWSLAEAIQLRRLAAVLMNQFPSGVKVLAMPAQQES
ncbi:hypothetical protein D9M71_679960 [compost metagenome]